MAGPTTSTRRPRVREARARSNTNPVQMESRAWQRSPRNGFSQMSEGRRAPEAYDSLSAQWAGYPTAWTLPPERVQIAVKLVDQPRMKHTAVAVNPRTTVNDWPHSKNEAIEMRTESQE